MPTVTFAHLDSMMRIVIEPSDASQTPMTEADEAVPEAERRADGRTIGRSAPQTTARTAAEAVVPSRE